MRSSRPLAAVSFKTYLDHDATMRWCRDACRLTAPLLDEVDLLMIPMATALAVVAEHVAGTPVMVGAQDCSWTSPGAYTGELPAEAIRDAGAQVVELGHAERRAMFGEDDATVARKLARAVEAGLTPLVCVGETERLDSGDASRVCVDQLAASLTHINPGKPLLVAYEPVWAIGANLPASPDHVRPVCRALGELVDDRHPGSRVLYGGTAGPGVFTELFPDVDGLFLGRRAHDVNALVDVVREMSYVAGIGHAVS
jgi:triosephosphate isomerase (TIM)